MSDIVRTFRGPDPQSALSAVKAALGAEAVILETREVGGLWGRPEVEVTAMRSLAEGSKSSAAGPAGADSSLQTELQALRRVVDELRVKLSQAPGEGAGPRHPDVPNEVVGLCRKLVRRGCEEHLAQDIIQEATRLAGRGRPQAVEETVRTIVSGRLSGARPPWEPGERRVIAMVGPTGVGKTTTIAKIAARALLESQLRVALITVDTYRIGAVEHLGRYGEIMGLTTKVAKDAGALAAAINQASDCELVLIDTAGRSDHETVSRQMGLLRSVSETQIHLVLSAASGAREMAAAARRYRDLGVHRLVFSKLDEADGPGSVLSAVAAVPRPLSCITNGQRVPDDIHAVTPSASAPSGKGNLLVDLIVGPARTKESPSWTKQRA